MRDKRRSRPSGGLAELAERQHGVVSIRQLTGPLGFSRNKVAYAVSTGHLHRLHRGVYAVGHTHLSVHARCLAAVLACAPEALLSHRSAAWLWGLSRLGPLPPHVTTPVPRVTRTGIRVHYARGFVTDDRRLEQKIPVTAVPRTLLDSAAAEPFTRLQRMLERCEELKLFDLGPVECLLERTQGHHGCGRLRRALALYRPVPFTRSGFERLFFEAVQRAGLPRPATNFVEAGFELDVYWPECRFAVELDTYGTHGTHGAFERDRLRHEDLKLAGIEMIRVTDIRFHREPDAVLDRVSRLLSDRRREMRVWASR